MGEMKTTRAVLSTGMLLGLAACLLLGNSHASAASGYYVASMDMTVDPGSQNFIESSLADARSAGADHFVLVLNTFGGDGGSMDNIVHLIAGFQASGGTVTVLVGPAGAHAFSAGAYIAEASKEVYMTPGTSIGSATPIIVGIPDAELNTTLAKDISGFKAYMQALTTKAGRNATATGLMVTRGLSYTAEEAARLNVITGLVEANSLEEALQKVGVPAGTPIHTPGFAPVFIGILSDPNVSGLLFLVGVAAILLDLFHPTLVVSVVGAIAVVLALTGLGLFGAPVTAMVLMVIGALFVLLEVKTHHGVSALAGVAIFAVGFLLVFQTPPPPAQLPQDSPPPANFEGIGSTTYLILVVIGGGVLLETLYLLRLRRRLSKQRPHLDPRRMVGMEGVLTSDLRAGERGTANVASEDWSVTSDEDLKRGTRVIVREVKGLTLKVEEA